MLRQKRRRDSPFAKSIDSCQRGTSVRGSLEADGACEIQPKTLRLEERPEPQLFRRAHRKAPRLKNIGGRGQEITTADRIADADFLQRQATITRCGRTARLLGAARLPSCPRVLSVKPGVSVSFQLRSAQAGR